MSFFAGFSTEFKNLGHQIASTAQKFCTFVKNDLDPTLAKVEAEAPLIEAFTAVVSPQAALIEKAAFYALGEIGQVLDGVDAATAANGVNLKLDTAAYSTLTSAIAAVKANVATTATSVSVPAPIPAVS